MSVWTKNLSAIESQNYELKKGVSEYQMSMELGQNRSYIQAISSGRSMPSMKQFLNICEYFEITPLQFFDAQENNPQLIKKALDGMRKMSDDDLIMLMVYKSLKHRKLTIGGSKRPVVSFSFYAQHIVASNACGYPFRHKLLVEGSAPSPFEHRISFCGCAFCERF